MTDTDDFVWLWRASIQEVGELVKRSELPPGAVAIAQHHLTDVDPPRTVDGFLALDSLVTSATTIVIPGQLGAELGISAKTLLNRRTLKQGPSYIKIGWLVRYRRTDVDAWLLTL